MWTSGCEKKGLRLCALGMVSMTGTFRAQVLWTACKQGDHITLSWKVTHHGDHALGACQNHTHSGPLSPPSETLPKQIRHISHTTCAREPSEHIHTLLAIAFQVKLSTSKGAKTVIPCIFLPLSLLATVAVIPIANALGSHRSQQPRSQLHPMLHIYNKYMK